MSNTLRFGYDSFGDSGWRIPAVGDIICRGTRPRLAGKVIEVKGPTGKTRWGVDVYQLRVIWPDGRDEILFNIDSDLALLERMIESRQHTVNRLRQAFDRAEKL